jgi:pheophorbide a oxygenase
VQGNRDSERGTVLSPAGPPTPAGFVFDQETFNSTRGTVKLQIRFAAPCLVRYDFPAIGRLMAVYSVPSARGWTRILMRFYQTAKPARRPMPLPARLYMAMLRFVERTPALEHALLRNQVFDGDNYLLHALERKLLAEADAAREAAAAAALPHSEAEGEWRRAYYMPGKFDTGVAAWRSWLERFGRKLPVLPRRLSDLPPLMEPRVVLDRWSQHTQHCLACQRTLKRIDFFVPALAAAAAVAALMAGLAVATGGAPLLSARVVWPAVAAAALLFVRSKLEAARALFVYTGYQHWAR